MARRRPRKPFSVVLSADGLEVVAGQPLPSERLLADGSKIFLDLPDLLLADLYPAGKRADHQPPRRYAG
jgi:hypothetical protein